MRISYNWLSDYVDHGLSSTDLADSLTMAGLEVEHTKQRSLSLEGVVVGQVASVRPHPDADRLQLCDVDLGTGELEQIVCGAPNVAPHQRVPVATVGTSLVINGKTIKIRKSKIRGQISMGMICAEDELGLSEDHQGIMVLTGNSSIGEPLKDYLRREHRMTDDVTFDLAITPNRPDATCHIGVARDLAALLNVPVKLPSIPALPNETGIEKYLEVLIHCPDLCGRYTAMIVQDVTVRPSPPWLKRKLELVGVRSVNNIVDATNYVMYECGQPLHAFDYDRIRQKKIIVRESVTGETFVTLDGKQHTLTEGVVLICDGKEPVALGGIMGGENSEIDDTTTNVLIESAWFAPSRTRRSAKALGISTDASYRFERGVDTALQPWAALRTAMLIVDLGGGTVVQGILDVDPLPSPVSRIDLRISRIHKILGVQIEHPRIIQILKSLGFSPTHQKGDDIISCTVPTYRPDVNREIDLIEEIVRIYGLENIPLSKNSTPSLSVPLPRTNDQLRDLALSCLTGLGFREIYTNSLLPDDIATQFSHAVIGTDYPPVRTLNAVSTSMATLRPSLLPGMLKVMQYNIYHSQQVLRFCEFGHVFHHSRQEASFIENCSEYDALLLGVSGPIQPKNWDSTSRIADFFDVKGDVHALLDVMRLDILRLEPCYQPTELTDYHITFYSDETRVGTLAKLSGSIQRSFDLPDPVFFAEFNWTRLVLLYEGVPDITYVPVASFPAVERDLAILVDQSQPVAPMLHTLHKVGQPLLKNVDVFDVYTGERIPVDKKSIAFALRFGAGRTLRDKEVDRVMQTIVNVLSKQFNATLRS